MHDRIRDLCAHDVAMTALYGESALELLRKLSRRKPRMFCNVYLRRRVMPRSGRLGRFDDEPETFYVGAPEDGIEYRGYPLTTFNAEDVDYVVHTTRGITASIHVKKWVAC